MLGYFDEDLHKQWLDEHESKKPKPIEKRNHLSHFYQGGQLCELTGEKRQTEVKLKCLEGDSSTSVSLYLMEPSTCKYVLGVESPLICDILPIVDEYGLVPKDKNIGDATAASKEDRIFVDDIEIRFENDQFCFK